MFLRTTNLWLYMLISSLPLPIKIVVYIHILFIIYSSANFKLYLKWSFEFCIWTKGWKKGLYLFVSIEYTNNRINLTCRCDPKTIQPAPIIRNKLYRDWNATLNKLNIRDLQVDFTIISLKIHITDQFSSESSISISISISISSSSSSSDSICTYNSKL